MESQPPKRRNQTALVTGGAVRIGAAICNVLAKSGWNVVVHVNQSRKQGESLCETLRTYGVEAWLVVADMGLPGAATNLFKEACAVAGHLDAIVNNAALFSLKTELPDRERERLFRVNLDQPVELIHNLYDHLRARKTLGSVVNLSDQRIARASREEATPYEISKMLLADATLTEARACAPILRVNALAPGAVISPSETVNKEPAGRFLLGRRPTLAEVADGVRWLLEAESVTGQTLYIDGGQHLV
jgi:NAD(P)-dependent dehydrogenase (short-subunit alcohol dehydrogenase family)